MYFNLNISVTRHGSCDILRKNSDLRMDWPTTLEMCLLHYFIWQDRLIQFDLDGECKLKRIFDQTFEIRNFSIHGRSLYPSLYEFESTS